MTIRPNNMNELDWIIVGVTAGGFVLGYLRGFIGQIFSFAGLFVAYLVAYKFYDRLAPYMASTMALPSTAFYRNYEFIAKNLNVETYAVNAISFALLFFGVKLMLLAVGHALHFVAKAPGVNALNRGAGAGLGLIEAVVLIVVAVHVLTIVPSAGMEQQLKRSVLAPYALNELPLAVGKLRELWNH